MPVCVTVDCVRRRVATCGRGACLLLLWLVLPIHAQTLSLHEVIEQLQHSEHPRLLQAQAQQWRAQAQAQQIEARYSTQAEIVARAQWVNPSSQSFDPSPRDHRLSLYVSKRLYDFGVTPALEQASQATLQASELDVEFAAQQHLIEVTRKYFDVLLADLEFAWRNEAMSMAYVTLDKMRERFALQQLDEVSLLQQEAQYQQSLVQRSNAELQQRVSRAALAEALNRPGELPATLLDPQLPQLLKPLPDPQQLVQQIERHAPQLRAQQQRVQAAQSALQAALNQWQPSLSADADYTEYKRELPSRENWRAGITLNIPLIESGIDKADVALARAELQTQRATLQLLRSQIREQAYHYWQRITEWQAMSRALDSELQYASRALDKSRGEYELERRTDFGQALVRISDIRYRKAKNDFQLQIAIMQLAMLSGHPPAQTLFAHNAVDASPTPESYDE